jgi:urease accessory protein
MDGAGASQTVAINARADSFIEYMPDPVILFPASDLSTRLTVNVHPSACVLLSDALLFHDPSGARRSFSRVFSETTIVGPDGGILARDRYSATGAEAFAGVPGLTGRFQAFGSFFLLAPEGAAERCLAPIGEALQSMSGTYAGVSKLPNGCGMWARVLATDAHELRRAIMAAWSATRVLMLGRPPTPRRK